MNLMNFQAHLAFEHIICIVPVTFCGIVKINLALQFNKIACLEVKIIILDPSDFNIEETVFAWIKLEK